MSENIQVKILEVSGVELAVGYAGLPMGKTIDPARLKYSPDSVWADLEKVITKLISLGDDHAKIMRQVVAHMEITAPRYWWQQWATYRAGTEMYSGSTMRQLVNRAVVAEDFSDTTPKQAVRALEQQIDRSGDLVRAKASLPEGYLQTRLVMVSYQTLRRMWLQRRKHRLPEWHKFLETLHELPYSEDLIFVEPHNPWRELWVKWFDFDGEPWYYDDEQVATFCFFCGNNKEYGHSHTCVYPKAKRLLDKEAR